MAAVCCGMQYGYRCWCTWEVAAISLPIKHHVSAREQLFGLPTRVHSPPAIRDGRVHVARIRLLDCAWHACIRDPTCGRDRCECRRRGVLGVPGERVTSGCLYIYSIFMVRVHSANSSGTHMLTLDQPPLGHTCLSDTHSPQTLLLTSLPSLHHT